MKYNNSICYISLMEFTTSTVKSIVYWFVINLRMVAKQLAGVRFVQSWIEKSEAG